MSIEKLKKNYPLTIRWIHFPLHPETPQEGRSLAELFAGRDIEPMRKRMKELMAEAGLEYGDRTHTYNSRLAQELGKWADSKPGFEAIHDALYRAYFAQALEDREFEGAVDDDWQRSRATGVTGVPTFYGNDLVVVGCQPYETLEKFVLHLLEMNSTQSEPQ